MWSSGMAQDKKEKSKEDGEMVQSLFTGRVCVQPKTDPITSGLLNLDRLPTRRR